MEFTTETKPPQKRLATQADCLDLLCRLENRLNQVQTIGGKGACHEKLDVVKLTLVEVTDFAEAHFGDDDFEAMASSIHAVYKRTKALEDKMRESSWSGVKRLLGRRDTPSGFEVTADYEALGKAYSLLFVDFFVACVNRFESSPEDKKSFLEGVDLFVTEFARAW